MDLGRARRILFFAGRFGLKAIFFLRKGLEPRCIRFGLDRAPRQRQRLIVLMALFPGMNREPGEPGRILRLQLRKRGNLLLAVVALVVEGVVPCAKRCP